MPRFRFQAMTASGEEISDTIVAETANAARTQLKERGLFVISLHLQNESQRDDTSEPDSATTDESDESPLDAFGWQFDSTPDGLRIRRSGLWHGSMAGCSLVLTVILGGMLFGFVHFVDTDANRGLSLRALLERPISSLLYIGWGMVTAIGVLQVLRFALVREDWLVASSRLMIRRSVAGFGTTSEFATGEFVLEPHYERNEQQPHWRLALHHDSRKRFLITRPLSFLSQSTNDSLTECRELAMILSRETGWPMRTADVGVERQIVSPSAADESELLDTLRTLGCHVSTDGRGRLVIIPARRGAVFGGVALIVASIVWIWWMLRIGASFISDRQVADAPWLHLPFWLIMSPMSLVGIIVFAAGIGLVFRTNTLTADRDWLKLTSRWKPWKAGTEFSSAALRLLQLVNVTSDNHCNVSWQLQLRSPSGTMLRVLCSSENDDLPRTLGAVLARRTGWPLETSHR